MDTILSLVIKFLIGGFYFVSIHIAANIFNNAALSAIVPLIPLSIISLFLIEKNKIIIDHLYNLVPVFIISIFCVLILTSLIKLTNININILVILTLLLWICLQYILYLFILKK